MAINNERIYQKKCSTNKYLVVTGSRHNLIDTQMVSGYNNQGLNDANLDNSDIPQGSYLDEGGALMDKNIDLYHYISLWLETFKKPEVKPGTFERLILSNESLGRYEIGQMKLREVTALDVQFYINQIMGEDYSFSTI